MHVDNAHPHAHMIKSKLAVASYRKIYLKLQPTVAISLMADHT